MKLDGAISNLVTFIGGQAAAEPAVLAVDVHRLAAMLLGHSPRQPDDPFLHAALQFHHEALKLESLDWVRPAPRLKVTYATVLSVVRLVFCWRALGATAERSAAKILALSARHCGQSRQHHLLPFWSELKAGECSERLRTHLLGPGARGGFDTGPYADDVFPFRVFQAELQCGLPDHATVQTVELAPELEDLLVTLALHEP
jgi:hypothetical protein